MTQRSSMVTSARGEATPRREKRGDDAVGLVRILLDRKMKKIYVVDSTVTNGCQRFKAMMSYFFLKKYMQVGYSFVHLIA
jgi:hypothetical protein